MNYEDLFSLTHQVADEAGWSDNAAIRPFRKSLENRTADLCGPTLTFESLANESLNFIQHVIARELRAPVSLRGFEWMERLSALKGKRPLCICTLNHDRLVERFLDKNSITYTDGFAKLPINGVRYFDAGEFDRAGAKVKLMKLHGSINLWRLRPNNGGMEDERTGIPILAWEKCRSPNGKRLDPLETYPRFLTGSDNKIAAYQAGIFLTLMRQFEQALDDHKVIIMCGYGWADKAISVRLRCWALERFDRKIILFHPRPNELRAARPLQHHFDKLHSTGRMVIVPNWLCDAHPRDILNAIRDARTL